MAGCRRANARIETGSDVRDDHFKDLLNGEAVMHVSSLG